MQPSSSAREARDQAAEYLGFTASQFIKVGEETFEIPNPDLLDDDQQQRYDELQIRMKSWDHDPDITLPDGRVIKGDLLIPCQLDGALVTPSYGEQLGSALFGDAAYKRFRKGGGSANLIVIIWRKMRKEANDRAKRDPKSEGSAVGLAAVPDAD